MGIFYILIYNNVIYIDFQLITIKLFGHFGFYIEK